MISLQRTGENEIIDGVISVAQTKGLFTGQLSGRWTKNEITLDLQVDSDSIKPEMFGIIVTLDKREVRITGQFSTEHAAIWVSNCILVSTSPVTPASS